jgi:hypothetical protein
VIRLLQIISLLFVILSAGCVSNPQLLKQSAEPFDSSRWQEYGAVYEYDELRIEESFDDDYGFDTSYTYNQKLHIINRKGLQYGTIGIPRLSDKLTEFKVVLHNAKGEFVELDIAGLRQKYIDTGTIAVPQVQPGSIISTTVTFKKQEPLYSFEYSFDRELPVVLGQFSFIQSFETEYAVRTYNTREKAKRENFNGKKGYTVRHENYLPLEHWGWKNGVVSEGYSYPHYPRVAINIERFRSAYGSYNGQTWEDFAQEYRDYILDSTFISSKAKIKRIVREIEQKYSDDYARADAILHYVQDNLTLIENRDRNSYSVNIDRVIKRKSGDYLEITVVLIEMLKLAGFDVKLYVSRSRLIGGFDSEFPGWAQLSLPLISVNIDTQDLVAYPFYRYASLGEYPMYYYNEKALQLDNGKIVTLPKPIKDKNIFTSDVTLSMHKGRIEIDWRCSLIDSLGFFYRDSLVGYKKEEQKRYWNKIIKKFSDLNSVKEEPEITIQRGEPILIQGKVKNQNLSVTKSGTEYVNLGPFFREYFHNAEDILKQTYINDVELMYEEKVTLPSGIGDKLTYTFQCEDLNNSLFRSECRTGKENNQHQLTRKITFKKVSIPAESWTKYVGEIKKLNEITKSHMILR